MKQQSGSGKQSMASRWASTVILTMIVINVGYAKQ